MYKLIVLILGCLIANVAFSQKITQSEREDFNMRTDDFSVVGKYKNSIACYRKRSGNGELILYNQQMIKQRTIPLDFLPDNYSNIRFLPGDNGLIVLFESKESKKLNLYACRMIGDNTWQQPVLLCSKPTGLFKDYIPYNISISENKKYILGYCSYFEGGQNILQSVILDNNMQIVKQTNQTFSDKEYFIGTESVISNSGIPFLLATDRPSNKGVIEELKLLTLSDFTKDFFVHPALIEKHYLNDVHIAIDNSSEDVYLTSFFSEGKYSTPRGIYFCIFNSKSQSFTANHFASVALNTNKTYADLKDVKIRHVFIKSNGGLEVVSEKYYQNVRTISSINPIVTSTFVTGPDNTRSVTEYYYDEVFIFNFKIDGSLSWSQTILKEQLSTDDGGIFSSFYPLQYPIGNAYVFNDLSSKTTRLLVCYVSAKGEMNMKQIQTNEAVDEWNLMPRSAKQLSKSELLMPCIMKNQLSFLKLTF